jgi:hypothetical protein
VLRDPLERAERALERELAPGIAVLLLHNKLHNAKICWIDDDAVNICIKLTYIDDWLDFMPVILKPLKLVRLPVPPLPRL